MPLTPTVIQWSLTALVGLLDEIRRPRHTGSINLAWQAVDTLQVNANVQYSGSQTDTFFSALANTGADRHAE